MGRRWKQTIDNNQVLIDIRELLLVIALVQTAYTERDTDRAHEHLSQYLARRREEVDS